eukprot:3271121-Pyramimonas_sp.AAC.1
MVDMVMHTYDLLEDIEGDRGRELQPATAPTMWPKAATLISQQATAPATAPTPGASSSSGAAAGAAACTSEGALATGSQKAPVNHHLSVSAIVIEDHRVACAQLRTRGYLCDRLTHNELMTTLGTQYLGGLISGDYRLLWISTPADWYVRAPGKKAGPHWQRQTSIRDALEDYKLHVVRMRLCHFGYTYDKRDDAPSGTYIQVATSFPLSTKTWQCNCKANTQHTLDWYGQDADHAEWRRNTLNLATGHLLDQVLNKDVPRSATFVSIYTRVDTNVTTYQRTPKSGPQWGDVQRRVTIDNDAKEVIQDINVADQPI